ncbi:MAG: aminopeptidase [Candidatus Thorarchaeota archaeon]
MDPRITQHADVIVNWSTQVTEGDMVLIRAGQESDDLIIALAGEIAKKKAHYIVLLESDEALCTYLKYADNETLSLLPRHYKAALEASDVIIWIDAPRRENVLAEASSEKLALRARTRESLFELSLSKRWCDTLHPCEILAQQAGMSLEEYRDFVYEAILIDWKEIAREMKILSERLNQYDDIRLLGPDTDLYAKTSGRVWLIEDGRYNMPSGEVYTSPLEDSVEGRIFFDVPFMYQGRIIRDVKLEFEKGAVVNYDAEQGERSLKSILDTDNGSRHLGEIAIGMNRGIKRSSMNMLFDEKMGDTIHCALGKALKACNGTNESAIHVDMIKSMSEGEIVVGEETFYRYGKFV